MICKNDSRKSEHSGSSCAEMSSKVFRRKTDGFTGRLSSSIAYSSSQTPPDISPVDEKGPLGLNLLYAPSEPLIDFVFVHGLGGGSRKTWSHSSSPADYWPKEWLPKAAGFENVRIHSFGYNSDYVKGRSNCWTIRHFSQSLLGGLRTSPCLSQADTPLVMIGHSMGGLVIKQAYMLARHDPSLEALRSRFQAIYFLATPHRGSDWAKVLDRMLNTLLISREFVDELKRGSGVLDSINEEFRHYFDQFELVSFYEMKSSKYLLSQIVDLDSGTLGYPFEKQIPMSADHRSICKFESQTEPNFIMIRDWLALTVKNISDKLATRKALQRQRELDDLARYLNIFHRPEDDLELVGGSRLSGTCKWIATKESYSAWRDFATDAPTILWINGKPATGKSVLAGYIIQELQESSPNCSYYFFKHGERSKSRLINCFRSLAFQMACKNDEIRSALYDLPREKFKLEGENERNIWLRLFVSTIFKTQIASHYWVIDAVDECESSETFIELLHSYTEVSDNLRILFTSRDTSKLKMAFHSLGSQRYCDLDISTSDTTSDIKRVIEAKSKALTIKDVRTRAALLEKVLQKSQGSFMWTILVLDELSNTYGEVKLSKVLDEVPRDMHSLYKRVLDSMELATEKGGREEAKAILKWVSCSTRPLSVAELTGALNLDLEDTYDALEEMIPKLCGQLVAVDIFGNVQIVHETIREYLISDSLKSDFAINKSRAHAGIAEICLKYLTSEEMKPATLSRRGSRKGSTMTIEDSRIKFSSYACTAFSHHLANANTETVDLLVLVAKFLDSNVLSWIEVVAQSKVFTPYSEQRKISGHFVRVVAKFSGALLALPAAIYTLLPPFCPVVSTIYKASANSRTTKLSVTGLSHNHWDDRLTCVDVHGETFTTIAHGNELFAVGKKNGVITLYHAASCQEYKVLDHEEALKLLLFKAKSDFLVSCGMKKVVVWNIRTGEAIYRFQAPFRSIALAFDEDILLVASERNFLRLWDLGNNGALQADRAWSHSEESTPKPFRLQPCAISISVGHQKLAVAYSGQAITIWDLEHDEYFGSCGKRLGSGETTTHLVTSLAFNPNSDIPLLAASYLDGELVLLDPFQGDELQSLRADCRALASSPNGRLLAGAVYATIHVYEFDTLKLLYRVRSSSLEVKQLAFSQDNFHFADIRRSQCNIWEPAMLLRDSIGDDQSDSTSTSIIEATTSDERVKISAMALHHQGQVLICGKLDGSVCLYDVRTGSLLQTLYEHGVQVHLLAWQSRNDTIMSVDISNVVRAYTLRRTPKEGWLLGRKLLKTRLDCSKSVVQILPCEMSNRLILATRESDHLWDGDGNRLAVLSCTQNPGVRLWLHHPRSQLHVCCVAGAIIRLYAWDDLTEVSSFELLVDMQGLQLKSLRAYESGRKCRILLEMSELDGSSRTRGLHLIDAASLNLESKDFAKIVTQLRTGEASAAAVQQTSAAEPGEPGKNHESATAPVAREALAAAQQEVITPLCGSRVAALSRHVSHIIHLSDAGKLIFLDTSSWVSSLSLDHLEVPMTGAAAATVPIAPPISYSRHFFVPSDWFSGTRDILCAATMRDIIFARNGEVAVVKGGLDYSEDVLVSPQSHDKDQVIRNTNCSGTARAV